MDKAKSDPAIQADYILKNANIYTVDKQQPHASALAIKDGKFVYVGDEAGLAGFEGEVHDAGGKFIMPGMFDSHAHIPCSLAMCLFKYPVINQRGKEATLADIAQKVHADAGDPVHYFMIRQLWMQGERISKEDLDAITTEEGIYVLEEEPHFGWCNSKMLEMLGYDDGTPDPAPGLSYLVRDENGHLTGEIYEGCSSEATLAAVDSISDEYIISEIKRLDAFCRQVGLTTLTECAMPAVPEFGERVYRIIAEMDRAGEISVDINGSYGTMLPKYLPDIMEELKRYNKEFNTEHLKVRTLKLWIDGTSAISTSYLLEPRYDNGLVGGKICSEEKLTELIKECDANGFDVHLHVIGDAAINMCLNAVEKANKELGRPITSKVTLAHNELCSDADIPRYGELGVFANFTPWWFAPPAVSGGYEHMQKALGERFRYEYRVRDIIDADGTVTFGCDQIGFGDFANWIPFFSMELGVTRRFDEKTLNGDYFGITDNALTPEQSCTIEELIEGYTINGAKQIGLEATKGSITVGKDADFIVLPVDLTAAPVIGISHTMPDEVYFKGKKVS